MEQNPCSPTPRIYYVKRPDHLPPWAPGRFFVLHFPSGEIVFFSRLDATDFVVVEAVGFWAATSEATTEAGIDNFCIFQSLNFF